MSVSVDHMPAQTDSRVSIDRPRRRVLVVTYTFPPVGGAGVQRVTKLVKYLGRHGWQPTVLTVANPSVPLYDRSLDQDVPPETEICRARSWEPGYALKAQIINTGTAPAKKSKGSLKRSAFRLVR